MKNKLCLLFSLIALNALQAQETPSVVKNQYKINALVPGFVYEHGFDTKNTLYSELSTGFGYKNNSYYGGAFYLYPTLTAQYRHYYNLERRNDKGKVTTHNSGGYFGFSADYFFQSISVSKNSYSHTIPSLTAGPVWGFERTYKRKFNIGLNLGVGANIDRCNTEIVPITHFSLGWVLGK